MNSKLDAYVCAAITAVSVLWLVVGFFSGESWSLLLWKFSAAFGWFNACYCYSVIARIQANIGQLKA